MTELKERVEKVSLDTPAVMLAKLESYDRSLKGSLDVISRDIVSLKQQSEHQS